MRSFVTATTIAQRLCSPSRDGQEILPQLVGKLITASVPAGAIHAFRFPAGDQVYLPGEDGILAIDDAFQHIYVPGGISVWEMGTSMDPKSKADDDFAKAEKKLANAFPNVVPAITPDKATFVFVTAKPWESGEWIRQKRATSTWKSIRVLDAVDLEAWIERCPAVMLWFADVCGLPAEGLCDAAQYIRRLGAGFGVTALSPEIVIAGRDADLERLTTLFLESEAEIHVRGESIEEAAAFLASASLREVDRYNGKPPLVFADSRADLNLLATCGAELTLVPLDSEALTRFRNIMGHNWRVIIPEVESVGPLSSPTQGLTLARCKRAAIERHLIEQMRFAEHRASQIARECKGSMIALLWLVGSAPMSTPRWATRKDATTHASLILAGSWIGSNENDTRIIERLSRNNYRDVETLLQSAEVPEGPWVHWEVEWMCVSRDFVWSQLVDKITETMLGDFHKIVCEVIGEKDPSLELESSTRHMAAILGKIRKHSSSLRGGLVDSLARLATLKSEGQGWANRIVHDLLDPERSDAIDRWLSIADVYSEIAEAAPDVFLDCLDSMLRTGKAKAFFQDAMEKDVMFSPTSAHVYLLWAMERLAWQKRYFSRVLEALAKLAEIDPGGKTSNRPQNSLITILLPWRPQHAETMQNAAQAIRMLYTVCPGVTWELAIALLPTSHSVTSPTPTPHYREYSGERAVTLKDYWEFTRTLVELMIEWAGVDAPRWASLIEKYPEVRRGYPEVGQLITDALFRVDAKKLTDEQKAMIHDALRDLVSRHRQHANAEWALPTSDLDVLETLQGQFKPEDTVLQYVHLFSWDPDIPDAPMKPFENGWDEWLSARQVEAAKAIYAQQGLAGICRLAEKAHIPECVGQAAVTLPLQEAEILELLQKSLFVSPDDHTGNMLVRTVRAFVWAEYKEGGDAWLDQVLQADGIEWTAEAYANLALGLPASPSLWQRIEAWGQQADILYWRNVEVRGRLREHWRHILSKWRQVTRPWSSLELIGHLVDDRHADDIADKPSAKDVIDVLEQALHADENVEPHRREGGMMSYYVEHAFLCLDSQSVAPDELARLEWGWLRVLEHTKRGVRALQTQVTSSPELFVDLLKAIYRAEDEPKDEDVSEAQRRLASQASRLLKGIHTLPGQQSGAGGETIAGGPLRAWILRTRQLAQEAKRLRVCDIHIGQILSYSPPSPDGSWPCIEVRNVIEEVRSAKIESGLCIGKCNQRGVVCRGEGGKQEWDLAKQYRALADKVRNEWPRTASILDSLARGYESEAREWDEEAKRDEYQ